MRRNNPKIKFIIYNVGFGYYGYARRREIAGRLCPRYREGDCYSVSGAVGGCYRVSGTVGYVNRAVGAPRVGCCAGGGAGNVVPVSPGLPIVNSPGVVSVTMLVLPSGLVVVVVVVRVV